jgi:signal transduction histidine kinase/ActR/RegA family two-component response regulator
MLIMLLPLLTFQAIELHDRYRTLYHHELQANLEIARATRAMFGVYVNSVVRAEASLLNGVDFDTHTPEDITGILKGFKHDAHYFEHVSWLDADGKVVASSRERAIGMDLSGSAYVRDIKQGRTWSISDLFVDPISANPVFVICSAVRDERGLLRGILAGSIDEQRLQEEISFERSRTAGVMIMDRNGRVVVRSPRIELSWEERDTGRRFPFIRAALHGRESVVTDAIGVDGTYRIMANIPMPFGWVAGAGRSQSEVTGAIWEQLSGRVILFLSMLAIGLFASAVVSRRITASVSSLRERSDAIARGEYIARSEIAKSKDFQDLAESLDAMSGKIRAREEDLFLLNEKLESAVKDRTLNLTSANRELARRAEQLRLLTGELTMAEQRERKRLAGVLHDGLQQYLVAAKMQVGGLIEELDSRPLRQTAIGVERVLKESIAVSRSLAAELSPPILHDAGILPALDWLARWMTGKHGVQVKLTFDMDPPTLNEDVKVLLFEAVRELLLNVVKHARTRSASVHLTQQNGRLRVTVSDDGAGFDCSRVVTGEPFATGFGLFSIRERIDLVGGRFEIASAPGEGSRLSLIVPLDSRADAAVRREDRQAVVCTTDRPVSCRIRVLLCDDHAVVREGLAGLLTQEPDLEVIGQACDGQEAIALADALRPEVILMDVSMPRMNGVEATQHIHRQHPGIRIIGLSLYTEDERGAAMLDAGASVYMSKTVPAPELKQAIRACSAESRLG